jgi:hypothetical protein
MDRIKLLQSDPHHGGDQSDDWLHGGPRCDMRTETSVDEPQAGKQKATVTLGREHYDALVDVSRAADAVCSDHHNHTLWNALERLKRFRFSLVLKEPF